MNRPAQTHMNSLHEAIAALKRNELAKAKRGLAEILAERPDEPDAVHYMGVCHYHEGNVAEAIGLIEKSISLRPDYYLYHQNLGGLLVNQGRYREAVELLRRALKLHANSPTALSSLTVGLFYLGQITEARHWGQKALDCKAALAIEDAPPQPLRKRQAPFDRQDRTKNIIAFSLWGSDPAYTNGAIENSSAARYVYPEWTCRFYCDDSVPREVIKRLRNNGGEIVSMPVEKIVARGLFWRFYASDDPAIDRFLCRDCDSVLNVRERLAVEEWIESEKSFHIMRDRVTHTELILAGMWGGVARVVPNMVKLADDFLKRHQGRLSDQQFLRSVIWPMIKDDVLTHDPNYQIGETRDFPKPGRLPAGDYVGRAVTDKPRRSDLF